MREPRVLNKNALSAPQPGDPPRVYIGRGSAYGNPFIISKYKTRDQVCDYYEDLIRRTPETIPVWRDALRGKDLVCFCAPQRCHGDFLLRLANDAGFK